MNDCDYCGGPLVELGSLGIATWSKCRNCGAEHVTHTPPEEPRREAARGETDPKRG